ncbi:MAG: HAMP domain-containing histidine kinase [Chitinophagaceae bacterium]|nr:HAMP domain-containing histidine kinase [Chitinophagaceae bacterium]
MDEVLLRVIADVQKQNNTYKVLLDFNDFPDDEKQLTTFGNVNLLYIALKNIIENGCKYAIDNQSSVLASFLPAKIIIQVANKGDIISESDIRNIFQPFFRADDVKSKPGFGLGLTLARRILSLHNGTIAVTSDPETGTVFSIELPRFLAQYK